MALLNGFFIFLLAKEIKYRFMNALHFNRFMNGFQWCIEWIAFKWFVLNGFQWCIEWIAFKWFVLNGLL